MTKSDPHQIQHLSDRFGLPLHLIFLEQVEQSAGEFFRVAERCYPRTLVVLAAKANPCRGAVRAAGRVGLGVDVASEYELQVSLEEGVGPEMIVCNGNAKSDQYLEMSVKAGTLVAVDNVDELRLLDAIGCRVGVKARALIRISGMPLTGFTSVSQSTAGLWTKFGFNLEEVREVFGLFMRFSGISFEGLSAHIGAQICDPVGYDRLFDHLINLRATAAQCGLKAKYIDIGGGFPVAFLSGEEWEGFTLRLRDQLAGRLSEEKWVTWDNLPMGYHYLQGRPPRETDAWVGKAYWSDFSGAAMLERILTHKDGGGMTISERLASNGSPTLIVEPGRALIGPAGVTVARALGVKNVKGNPVVILDMGINNHGTNLLSPDIFPVEVLPNQPDDSPIEVFLAGRLCFSSDMISMAKVRMNRLPRRGDLIVIHCTGAYSADHFASNSCGFPVPAKVAIHKDGRIEVWRRAETFEDVFAQIDTV